MAADLEKLKPLLANPEAWNALLYFLSEEKASIYKQLANSDLDTKLAKHLGKLALIETIERLREQYKTRKLSDDAR